MRTPRGKRLAISAVAPGALAVTSITADGNYTLDGAGHYAVRYRVGTASATASASATIYYDATASVGLVRETNSAAIAAAVKLPSSFGSVTIGTAFTPGVGLAAVCTAAGNVVMAGADGSTITAPVGVGYNQFGFAVANVPSETATCTFTALR
ncbi:MAG: hypothetical protein ACYDD1_17940 [Caulobacteraceae bacterium]